MGPVPYPYAQVDAADCIAGVGDKNAAVWLILRAKRLIGVIGREPELGYWLDPKYWGQGLMREAAQAVLGAHFTFPVAVPMPSCYMLGNARSAGLLHGLGFSPFGAVVQRKNMARDALVDIRQMILTPE